MSELHPAPRSEHVETPPARSPDAGEAPAIFVALPARGQILGAMGFVGRRYTARDLALAEELGRRYALAIDNARLYDEGQAALRLRSEVLASVTHDLKNPLARISGAAQVLDLKLARGKAPPIDEVRTGLQGIHERARAMARQLDELIDVAALEAGQSLELHREPTDLVAMARRVAAEAQETSDRHEVEVGAESEAFTVELDVPRFERVLRNLLSNAVKYSPDGGPVTVGISGQEEASQRSVVLTVRDEGVGIPAGDLPSIFDQFRRGSNVAGRIDGTGLGLGAVCQIVHQHGGTIAIGSQEGAGTVVTIRLPA